MALRRIVHLAALLTSLGSRPALATPTASPSSLTTTLPSFPATYNTSTTTTSFNSTAPAPTATSYGCNQISDQHLWPSGFTPNAYQVMSCAAQTLPSATVSFATTGMNKRAQTLPDPSESSVVLAFERSMMAQINCTDLALGSKTATGTYNALAAMLCVEETKVVTTTTAPAKTTVTETSGRATATATATSRAGADRVRMLFW